MPFRPLLAPSFARRLARATRHRPRSFHTTPSILAESRVRSTDPSTETTPAHTALSALLSRLSLPPDERLHPALLTCLTHRSFSPAPSSSPSTTPQTSSSSQAAPDAVETNEVLSSLGNSLLGLFASEHLSNRFPHLPTTALKQAVTAYVGPPACFAVARELGLGTQNISGKASSSRTSVLDPGVMVRWQRSTNDVSGADIANSIQIPVARRFNKFMSEGKEGHRRHERKDGFEDVVSGAVKAMVGLIYQEKGIHAARKFTHAHFLTRHLDMAALFNFKNPKHVLSSVVAGYLADKGVEPSSGMGKIESRLLASSGTASQAPLFNIGLYLPSGLKLAEGFGSSLKMAEHRAAVNALLSIFLVRNTAEVESGATQLPSSIHASWPVEGGVLQVLRDESRTGFSGVMGPVGGKDLVESRR